VDTEAARKRGTGVQDSFPVLRNNGATRPVSVKPKTFGASEIV